jgi:hypothetical protein
MWIEALLEISEGAKVAAYPLAQAASLAGVTLPRVMACLPGFHFYW